MQQSSVILLDQAQHEQVKTRLAQILGEEYSIINQSAGKLEYLTARLMGFDNHQQRKVLLSSGTAQDVAVLAQESHAATGRTATWPPRLQSGNGDFSESDQSTLKAKGWFPWDPDGDYQDWEYEITYEPQQGLSDRRSFNVQMTVDQSTSSVLFSVGDNHGDGFNPYAGFTYNELGSKVPTATELRQRINNAADKNFIATFNRYMVQSADLIEALRNVIAFLGSPAQPVTSQCEMIVSFLVEPGTGDIAFEYATSEQNELLAEFRKEMASHMTFKAMVDDAADINSDMAYALIAKELWRRLGNVPTDDLGADGLIDEDFLHMPKGTAVYDVWNWFEETFSLQVHELMFPK